MRSEEIRQAIKQMEPAEKLLLVEDVWESIVLSYAGLPHPEWQKRELDKRYKQYKSGEQNLHNWKTVHENLKNCYK